MNIFRDFTITMSKACAVIIICAAPFVLEGALILAAWGIAQVLLTGKQLIDKNKINKND